MMEIKQISDRYYQVKSSDGEEWYDVFVDRGKNSCTCNDFVFRGAERPCKHVTAVLNVSEVATDKCEKFKAQLS